jgi:hypothetical protein
VNMFMYIILREFAEEAINKMVRRMFNGND